MKSFGLFTTFCLAFQISLCAAQGLEASDAFRLRINEGLVVEDVTNGEAKSAGVRTGDVFLEWKQGLAQGSLKSPFDLSRVFLEQAPRGPVILMGLRDHHQHRWLLHSDTWGISVRPNFLEPLLSLYKQGEKLFANGKLTDATICFHSAAADMNATAPDWLAPWFLSHAAKRLLAAKEWDRSDALYEEAITRASFASDPEVKAELLRLRADERENSQDLAGAQKYFKDVLFSADSLDRNTMIKANILFSLGLTELRSGEYNQAERHFSDALEIGKKIAPNSIQTILTLANLAVVYQDEGEFESAEEFYLRALEKEERYFPNSVHLERTLNDLGILFDQEGDLGRAEAYHLRALRVATNLDPMSLDVADILANLAECVLERGYPLRAESYQQRALSIRERNAPASLSVANSLAGLGKIARVRGDFVHAEQRYRRALSIIVNTGGSSRDQASVLIGLATVLRRKSDLSGAETLYREALVLIEKDDPTSVDRATTLAELAGTMYRLHRVFDALETYREAFKLFENSALHLGNIQEMRSRYRAEHARYYEEYTTLLIEQGQPALALETLEGARARTLLEMLMRVHVDPNQGDAPAFRERERNLYRLLNAKTEYRIRLLSQSHTTAELANVDQAIEDLLFQYQQVQAQLRTGLDYAELDKPQSLSIGEIQNLLDPNTLLLEYSLTDDQSHVWAVTDRSLDVYSLPNRHVIEAAVRRVYRLLTSRSHDSGGFEPIHSDPSEKKYGEAAQRLSEMVLGPIAPLLKGKRLLIVSDGALQYLPFSALPVPGARGNRLPLIVNHEIVNLPSASVLAQLRWQALGRKKATKTVAVLADPVFDTRDERLQKNIPQKNSPSQFGHLRSDLNRSAADLGLTRDGNYHLSRLLYTRNEAEAVMAVTPAGSGMLALDFAANRQLATSSELAKYRIVHFATHGLIDNKHPELSGLVLSLFGPDGRPQPGFLKLQDIYNMRLPVDLIVLSGCETGLGEQISGEGLIGLTRGFMNAGATRVVSSLWKISDTATSILMSDFYSAMQKQGMRPAAALRAAQIQMWKRKQWRSPYYWAAFQMHGEWK